jgi:hypothetical protein
MKKISFTLALLLVLGSVAHAQVKPMPMKGNNSAAGSFLFSGTTVPDMTVTWNGETTARYLMIFDGPLPSNGSVTRCDNTQAASCLLYCAFIQNSTSAPGVQAWDWIMHPFTSTNGKGITAAASTGAGCGTLTVDAGAGDFFESQIY